MGQKISNASGSVQSCTKSAESHMFTPETPIVAQKIKTTGTGSELKSFSKPWSVVIKSDIEEWTDISSNVASFCGDIDERLD